MKPASVLRRYKRTLITIGALAFVAGVNAGPAWTFVAEYEHEQLINSDDYKRQYGHWDVIDLPADVRVNAIHAALLKTGKLLIVAGSGNDETQFNAGTFKTLLYDPATGGVRLIPTPADLFCGGHAFLPDGKLLVAGGTLRYEVLQDKVTNAAGTITVKNESPDGGPRTFPKGIEFVAPNGQKYRAGADFTVVPAHKVEKAGKVTITASEQAVWVEAEQAGPGAVTYQPAHYTITGLTGDDQHNLYGLGGNMTLDKQDYHGIKDSYEFDPVTERYEKVADLNNSRWYPTLTGLPNGDVLAVSGLDGSGNVLNGDNEIYDPASKTWTTRPDLKHYFPTYPALFQTASANTLFFSGSNSGYGPANKGRDPGLWDLSTNHFTPVPGLRDPDQLETSGSAWIGPVQDQRMMVVGGGGVGESDKATSRIDVIDLKDPHPHFTAGPDLPDGTRYPSVVNLPDDTTLITGGSRYYRGRDASDNHTARIYHSDSNTLTVAADPTVGRDYHSEALLLPDGRVITLGGNPLFSDEKNTISAPFEQRIEIYTPPYLYHGARPAITDGPAVVQRGQTAQFTTPDASRIATARLIRPSAVTHVTNVEQRSIALGLSTTDGQISVTVPGNPAVVPPGNYMLFVTDRAGVPSVARWVQIP
ncbi:galactose oxidase-like domain-containing protein [Amycolatopsis sp. GM8]|uniref:galactose oxidase-like domain-containing protein n=1 Tax=Amycolatopsis sp. GM8 TaxID=2896530 RepID=UPI001F3A5338|nr:galactose oxidase-like domain-containing protein [Amycolatopsis sp. GM8]